MKNHEIRVQKVYDVLNEHTDTAVEVVRVVAKLCDLYVDNMDRMTEREGNLERKRKQVEAQDKTQTHLYGDLTRKISNQRHEIGQLLRRLEEVKSEREGG